MIVCPICYLVKKSDLEKVDFCARSIEFCKICQLNHRRIGFSLDPTLTSPTGQQSRAKLHKTTQLHTTYLTYYILTYYILTYYILTYILTYLHTYIITYLPNYILTYLHTYIHTYLHIYLHTYIHTTYLHTYIHSTMDVALL